jgi:hypothetical protein
MSSKDDIMPLEDVMMSSQDDVMVLEAVVMG